ncbi:MAG: MFS transporter [Armatimonadetes bacterium]|nr:MFS transporter [Armatimonadota bacterium]
MGLTSFLSDAGHEMATTVLPAFLTLIGAPASALGLIEGIADALSSFVKLLSGWYGDRLARRKPLVVGGYLLTGVGTGLLALASSWPFVLFARSLSWLGRGVKGPPRDAMLAESVPKESRGKAFGFHRAGDTLGAVLGPLMAVGLLALLGDSAPHSLGPYRLVFALSLIPGLLAGLVFALLVVEHRRKAQGGKRLWLSVRSLPRPYIRLLAAVGLNGLGNFAPTLLILAGTELLSGRYGTTRAAQIAGLLYVVHNVFYAGMSYPVGALSDRWGRRGLLALGYFAGGLVAAGLVVAFALPFSAIFFLAVLFALNGSFMATQDSLEGAITADRVERANRSTAYGVMATVNGVGDFAASAVVGLLWTLVSPTVAFAYAAALMWSGAGSLAMIRRSTPHQEIHE